MFLMCQKCCVSFLTVFEMIFTAVSISSLEVCFPVEMRIVPAAILGSVFMAFRTDEISTEFA